MTEPQPHTSAAQGGRPINGIFGTHIGDAKNMITVLDDAIPLQEGVSHADVLEYVVEIPLRYAECCALLADGRKVGLRNPREFVGWSRNDPNRSLLFHSDGEHFEVAVERRLRGRMPGCIRRVFLEAKSERPSGLERKFIGVDGDLIVVPVWPTTN